MSITVLSVDRWSNPNQQPHSGTERGPPDHSGRPWQTQSGTEHTGHGGVTEWSRELKRHTREKQKLQNNCEIFNYEQCCTG